MSTATADEWEKAKKDMEHAGKRDGAAVGTWIADANTKPEVLRETLRLWEDGDPGAPCPPSPLSGEWGDMPAAREVIGRETDLDPASLTPEEVNGLYAAYDEAYAQAWQESAEKTVRGLLPEEKS
jgi:hypothetical protein